MFALTDYDYTLPEELIAQTPSNRRDHSRLLHLNRASGKLAHHRFSELPDLLKSGDVLVVNDTAVIPARMFGVKETGGRFEILIVNYASAARPEKTDHSGNGTVEYECLVKTSKAPRIGTRIDFGPELSGQVTKILERTCTIRFTGERPFDEIMDRIGVMPLPPYIKRDHDKDAGERDQTAYQTVYATHKGAVAAPTAGLHFSNEVLDQLTDKGISVVTITLHVGYGTFMPIRSADIRDHRMHAEQFVISQAAADTVNRAKAEGRRVVAVGTTSVRTLEYATDTTGSLRPGPGNCDLFIYPGFEFKCVDAVITNFHLPQSTLILLVSAFAGREKILNAYNRAVTEKYRFFSYGDAMFIE
ncbi:MAG: tRNA preQ1(34) S-adenosylmethionine ribosyltransferase-isomerase QueA [Desulfosalsimonadaceae bacterium]|nr:tRNA preQ1(34) S-adenosylmethionine ribosyltransferase-isomerase QueA [Desulfosalsimonadaceae bacterium]